MRGRSRELYRTLNGGATWTPVPLPTILGPNMHGDQRFRFVSPSIGFAEEDQEFDPHVHYFRTVEGGAHFSRLPASYRPAVEAAGRSRTVFPGWYWYQSLLCVRLRRDSVDVSPVGIVRPTALESNQWHWQ